MSGVIRVARGADPFGVRFTLKNDAGITKNIIVPEPFETAASIVIDEVIAACGMHVSYSVGGDNMDHPASFGTYGSPEVQK